MTDIEKLVDDELTKIVTGNPMRFVKVMLAKMGQLCVEANASTMDVSQECNVGDDRYKISASIKISKISSKIIKCENCGGTGDTSGLSQNIYEECDVCHGSGQID